MSQEKQQYIENLKKGKISIKSIYDYYKEFNTKKQFDFSFDEFKEHFMEFKEYFNFNIDYISDYFNGLFDVKILRDKNNKIIKIY